MELSNYDYNALFDSNVLSSVLDLARGNNANDIMRDTAALMAFLMSFDCLIEPGISAQEYSIINGEEKTKANIKLFRQADNIDPAIYADIVCGLRNSISTDVLPSLTNKERKNFQPFIPPCYGQYYTALLKLGIILYSKGNPLDKLKSFMEWQRDEYFFGAAITIFAVLSLGPNPVKDPLKQINKRYRDDPLKGIRNAAWDLNIVKYWGERVFIDHSKNKHWLFCSFDSILQEIARYLIVSSSVPLESQLKQLVERHWPNNKVDQVLSILSISDSINDDPDRNARVLSTKQEIVNLIPVLEAEFIYIKSHL